MFRLKSLFTIIINWF